MSLFANYRIPDSSRAPASRVTPFARRTMTPSNRRNDSPAQRFNEGCAALARAGRLSEQTARHRTRTRIQSENRGNLSLATTIASLASRPPETSNRVPTAMASVVLPRAPNGRPDPPATHAEPTEAAASGEAAMASQRACRARPVACVGQGLGDPGHRDVFPDIQRGLPDPLQELWRVDCGLLRIVIDHVPLGRQPAGLGQDLVVLRGQVRLGCLGMGRFWSV